MIYIEELENPAQNEFCNYRGAYIQESIKIIQNKLSDKPYLHDYVDIAIANKGAVNTCCKCKHTYKKELNICHSCNNNENMYDIEFDPYYRTVHNHPEDPPKIIIREPVMVNANSIESVCSVIEHIQNQTHLCDNDHDGKWTFLHSDGVPYVYSSDIQDYYLKCSDCKEEVDTKGLLKDEWEEFLTIHKETHKNDTSEFEFKQIFNKITLILGPGHIEMNMARLLLWLLWEPFLCEFAKFLGFCTPRAQEVVKNGIDHHCSRYILQSTLETLSKELFVLFVKEYIKFRKETTKTNFQKFLENVKDENYIFIYHVTFSYLLAFHLYMESVHKNHSLRVLGARIQIAPLFYSFFHPKYQQLHLRDLFSACANS